MTPEFITAFTDQLTQLVAGLVYDHKPTPGTKRVVEIHSPMMPKRAAGHQEGQHEPYLRWGIYGGDFVNRDPDHFNVFIVAEIYTAGSIDDGNRDILELTRALGRIVEHRFIGGYKLAAHVRFTIGDTDPHTEGLQPDPYYCSRLSLEFIRA